MYCSMGTSLLCIVKLPDRYKKTMNYRPRPSPTEDSIVDQVEVIYTVEDAVDYIGFGPFQILMTLFAGMIWVKSLD